MREEIKEGLLTIHEEFDSSEWEQFDTGFIDQGADLPSVSFHPEDATSVEEVKSFTLDLSVKGRREISYTRKE